MAIILYPNTICHVLSWQLFAAAGSFATEWRYEDPFRLEARQPEKSQPTRASLVLCGWLRTTGTSKFWPQGVWFEVCANVRTFGRLGNKCAYNQYYILSDLLCIQVTRIKWSDFPHKVITSYSLHLPGFPYEPSSYQLLDFAPITCGKTSVGVNWKCLMTRLTD